MSKRILSILMVMVMVFAVATTACGKKEDAAEKEELKKEETTDVDESDQQAADDQEVSEAENEVAVKDEVMKTGDDVLTDEEYIELEAFIRESVINEYLQPNDISLEEFVWPNLDDESWGYFINSVERFVISLSSGVEMPMEEPSTQNQKLMKAVLNGIINWHESQGSYNTDYFLNTMSLLKPYNSLIPTIDITSK